MYWLNKIIARIKLHFSTNQNKTWLMEKAKDYEEELQQNKSIYPFSSGYPLQARGGRASWLGSMKLVCTITGN